MAIFVGAGGQLGLASDSTGGMGPGSSAYSPDRPAFWSLVILAALVAAVIVIARGAM